MVVCARCWVLLYVLYVEVSRVCRELDVEEMVKLSMIPPRTPYPTDVSDEEWAFSYHLK
jgi:hypothetical protein